MNADMLYDAIGEIWEDLVEDAEQAHVSAWKRFGRAATAACLVVSLLALPVGAEIRNGYVSNLLAPLYGGAQTELVDHIGVPIGASVTVGDYTLTADAVIGDRYNIAIVYSLTRVDGGELAERTCFSGYSSSLIYAGSGGGMFSPKLSDDRRTLYITQTWTSLGRFRLWNRNVEIDFSDLVVSNGDGTQTLIAEGNWKLEFIVRYEDTTQKLAVKNFTVTSEENKEYRVKKILLSPLGVHIDLTMPNPYSEGIDEATAAHDFTVAVSLKDGTTLELTNRNFGWSGDMESDTFNADFGVMFETPIPMDEIQALILCGTRVPVE